MSSKVKVFTLEDVRKHNKPDDLWIVIHDKVYDLTKFASEVRLHTITCCNSNYYSRTYNSSLSFTILTLIEICYSLS